MTDDLEQATVEDSQEAITETVERGTEAVSEAAEIVGTTITDAIPTAIVGAMDRILGTQNRLIQLVEAQGNMISENLNALSRAQANTDVSAQRAAEAAQDIDEALTPEKESSPDQGEQPEKIKELPRNQQTDARNRKYGFGKAAERHGR